MQLYEVMMTRHTTMVVGQTGGGKTVIINTLSRAQTKLGKKTHLYTINPKAISVSELYGVLDKDTRDWTDGLLSNIFRCGPLAVWDLGFRALSAHVADPELPRHHLLQHVLTHAVPPVA